MLITSSRSGEPVSLFLHVQSGRFLGSNLDDGCLLEGAASSRRVTHTLSGKIVPGVRSSVGMATSLGRRCCKGFPPRRLRRVGRRVQPCECVTVIGDWPHKPPSADTLSSGPLLFVRGHCGSLGS